MEILYLLVPLSVLLVFALLGLFAWSLWSGQFDDLEREGERILDAEPVSPAGHPDEVAVDGDQRSAPTTIRQSGLIRKVEGVES